VPAPGNRERASRENRLGARLD